MRALVTGAAGYIGSVVAQQILDAGHEVVALDNLSQGHRAALPRDAEFILGDITDQALVQQVFGEHSIDVTVHLAAQSVVSRSMQQPGETFRANVAGTLNLLEAMVQAGVNRMVFSSTAAVYSEDADSPITEDAPKAPINPYGESKLMTERMLRWFFEAHGGCSVSLRYFNAAGATETLGEDHHPETHLVPSVLRVALGEAPKVTLYGGSFPTPDGSAVRDFVHVSDIAAAHLQAMERVERLGYRCYNLGTGRGDSVLEVVQAARRVTGKPLEVAIRPPRPGDRAVLVAKCELAKQELGWSPQHNDLEGIIESAWRWMQSNPGGYPHSEDVGLRAGLPGLADAVNVRSQRRHHQQAGGGQEQ